MFCLFLGVAVLNRSHVKIRHDCRTCLQNACQELTCTPKWLYENRIQRPGFQRLPRHCHSDRITQPDGVCTLSGAWLISDNCLLVMVDASGLPEYLVDRGLQQSLKTFYNLSPRRSPFYSSTYEVSLFSGLADNGVSGCSPVVRIWPAKEGAVSDI